MELLSSLLLISKHYNKSNNPFALFEYKFNKLFFPLWLFIVYDYPYI